MHINSLEIDKYQILENLNIDFQVPKDNKSVVNIIAGVNGSGKSTLLHWILNKFSLKEESGSLIVDEESFDDIDESLSKNNKYQDGIHSSPRVIYIPSHMIFNYQAKNSIDTSYKFINTVRSDDIIGNADLYIKEYVINQERLSTKSSPQQRTKDAIDKFNYIFRESDFITKLVDLDCHNQNRPIFKTINGDFVTIDKLSSGEQQLYARVVSLLILKPHDCVILIDEPEIALHPKWQIEIMKIYSNIGEKNQFIVTTHSPFIISQTPYKNLTFLVKEDEKIIIKQFTQPPLDRDINTIVKTMMGAEYLPKQIDTLHKKYRVLFEEGKLDTQEAEDLKNQILEYESPNSSFFQGIEFDKALM